MLSENDKMFLNKLQEISKYNRENPDNKTMLTNKGLLSDTLLEVFNIGPNAEGGWFCNVYIEFEEMFKEKEAKEWQG